jgi:Winged helix-turn-helix domain (DUF2582)
VLVAWKDGGRIILLIPKQAFLDYIHRNCRCGLWGVLLARFRLSQVNGRSNIKGLWKEKAMKDKVGEAAGCIWRALKDKGEIKISQIPRIIKEKTMIAYQAIGWLACENKIAYREKGDDIYVSLIDSE